MRAAAAAAGQRGGPNKLDPRVLGHPASSHTMAVAVAATLPLQLQASAQASSASTSGRPWAPLRPASVRQQVSAASGRRQRAGRRMSAAVQAVAAEPAVAANGATGARQLLD